MKSNSLYWIEQQKPELVRAAEAYLKQHPIFEPEENKKAKDPKVSGSQLRNLLNAAQSGASLPVLKNFLRYQIGRKRQGWADAPSGEALIELLEREVRTRFDGAQLGDGAAERRAVESQLAALLLGYLVRHFTYLCAKAGTSGR